MNSNNILSIILLSKSKLIFKYLAIDTKISTKYFWKLLAHRYFFDYLDIVDTGYYDYCITCYAFEALKKKYLFIGNRMKFNRKFLNRELCLDDKTLKGVILQSVPSPVSVLSFLTCLNLYNNNISGLPRFIGGLMNLTTLNVGRNRLEDIRVVTLLTGLENLYIDHNKIKGLPIHISQLVNLKIIWADNNEIEYVTKGVYHLPKLRELYLNNNKIVVVSNEIDCLQNLKILRLDNNFIRDIPTEIGNLILLKDLSVDNNKLTSLPCELGNLSFLKFFSMHNNEVECIPREISDTTMLGSIVVYETQCHFVYAMIICKTPNWQLRGDSLVVCEDIELDKCIDWEELKNDINISDYDLL